MNNLKYTDAYYEGEIIDMFSFTKKKSTHKKEKDEVDVLLLKNEVDSLSLKVEVINQKIDSIFKEIDKKITIIFNEKSKKNKKNNKLLNYYNNHPLGTSVAASIIATIILNSVNIFNNYVSLPSKLNSIETKLDAQISNYNDFTSEINKDITQLKVNVGTLANVTDIYLYSDLEYTEKFTSQLSAETETETETIKFEYYASAPPCQNEDVIAIDNKNGITYTKKQLTGEKLLIPYKCNGQEVLFYGQYDVNNNWDQDCTINVYENDKLVLISETEYKNGTALYSKQAFPMKTKEEVNVWSITDREYDGGSSYGETWNYFKFNDYLKDFEFEKAETTDIIYVSDFEDDMKTYSYLEGYYRGTNQNGVYNDTDSKNESFMVKYDRDDFIRTLYIGNFKDGDFNDHTGKAEEIVFDGTVNRYFYYAGTFTGGKRDHDDNLKYITQEEINKIIEPYNFKCELKWHET